MSHFSLAVGLVMFGYLSGSVPWGVVLTRMFAPRVDLRTSGSGNIGATNVRRTAGWRLALATLAADAAKGAVPVLLARLAALPDGVTALVAAAAFLGHLYPLYSGFRGGGKGVATAGGCLAVLSMPALAVCLLAFAAVVALSRKISAASLTAATVMPPAVWGLERSPALMVWAVLTTAFIWLCHRSNITRLSDGTEPRI